MPEWRGRAQSAHLFRQRLAPSTFHANRAICGAVRVESRDDGLASERLVFDAVWLIGISTETLLAVDFVFTEVALEPTHL